MSVYVSSPRYAPRLTRDERLHNVRVLTRLGQSANEIAIRLGMCCRTVVRYRRLTERRRDAAAA